ncbi:MAG: hypothetical protein KKC96_01840 [Nanoarchaeota archaeon]|nr:hypothetical protein [Nanoarchaeota archaeon]
MVRKKDVSAYGPEDSYSSSQMNSSQGIRGFIRSIQPAYILIVFVAIFILTLLSVYIASRGQTFDEVLTCGDGTFYNTCSLDKPYYCDNGVLIERASVCGCSNGNPLGNLSLVKQEESCVLSLETNPLDIELKYFIHGREGKIDFIVYEGVQEHVSEIPRTLYYQGSETPFRKDFKIKSLSDEVQKFNLLKLVKKIQNLVPESKEDQARIAVSIVQNIPYGASNKTISLSGNEVNYSRYPYEVLYEFEGICGEKSGLMVALLKELGYGTAIFYFLDENHEAAGIKCPVEKSFYGSGFCFVESGGPAIISDSSMEFVGGEKLLSTPQVMIISDGISLPKDLEEYDDAKTISDIRNKNIMGYLKFWRYDGISEKYNFDGAYELK